MTFARFSGAAARLARRAAAAFFAVAAAAQAEAFRFVQISDTHHGRPLHQYRYRKAIEEINALPFPVECVVHTGDIVSNGFKSQEVAGAASNMLALVEAPAICCPGNHDLVFKYSDPTNRFLRCAAVYKRFFGPLAQVHETSNAVFVAICTESLRLDAAPRIPGFDPLAWLDETLSARAGKPAFVCTHVPDCDDYFRGVFEPGWENAENLAAWRAVLARHPDVKAVLAGHFHRNAYAEHGDGGPPTVVASCFAGFWGRQASYRVFTFEDGRLSWQDAYIEDPPPDVFITGDGRAIPESADSAPAPAPEPPAAATP